jgi:hypothetical protein
MSQKTPRNFFKPLAIGAPEPMRDLPVKLERMIHFVPPHLDKVRAKVPDMAPGVDVILANLEDAIPPTPRMPPAPAPSKWPPCMTGRARAPASGAV